MTYDSKSFGKLSLSVPPRRPIFDVLSQIRQEYGLATNIRELQTRARIIEVLTNVIDFLKELADRPVHPTNGFIIYADFKSFVVIEPDEPVQSSMYRMDDHWIFVK